LRGIGRPKMQPTNCASNPSTGGPDYAAACDYILNRFVSLNQAETKQIYTHFTCATDTTQIRFVMSAVNGQ
jgi:guanine nucleotide-binding protein G(i) subunit alpha